ncbi:MAG: sterol desaturase family protein [Hyphomicrobium sp.]|nr:sterol desaturase family protein [Hyphomicrobium sp.]
MIDWLNQTILYSVVGALQPVLDFFVDGNSRFYWLYCLTGIAIAAYGWHKHKEARSFKDALLDKEMWLSTSALNDYAIVVLTPVLRLTVLSALMINWEPVSAWVVSVLHSAGVSGTVNDSTAILLGVALTLTLFVVDDGLKWLAHYLFHAIPELWEFHKVHHSAEHLNFVTADRHHPVEVIATATLTTIAYGLVNGLFIGLFGDKLTITTIMGANVFLFVTNICGGALRHSPFWITFGPRIEKWIISPAMHQLHHSDKVEHFDRNYGGSLAVWDRLAGSLLLAGEKSTIDRFGIGEETKDFRSLGVIYFRPFKAAANLMRNRFKRPEPAAARSTGQISV